jgi:peptidoglycan/xylan/chitin deacetylase (PgdA/CDA1 family)
VSAVAAARHQVRQLVFGLAALPLTALPFVGYANLTPEGRLVRDRAMVALSPPSLPKLSLRAHNAAAGVAPRYEGAVMALAYHGIGSASDSEGGFVVSAKRFGEHLATLKAAGMNVVTAAQIAEAFTGGPSLPPNAVMISFDDGRTDAMMFADPLLEQAGMAATMFLITGAASEPGIYYASWDKVEGYARSGRWDIQSHTAESHREHDTDGSGSLPKLTSLAPDESIEEYRARIHDDLATASAEIEEHTGRRPVAFAYPFGAYGADRSNDPAIIDVLREEVAAQYAVAFQQDEQETVPLLTPDMDLLRLRRVEVENWTGLQLLQRIARAMPSQGPGDDDAPDSVGELALPPLGGPAPPRPEVTPSTIRSGSTRSAAGATRPTTPVTLAAAILTPPTVTSTVVPATAPPTTGAPVTTTPPTTRPPSSTTSTTRPPTSTTSTTATTSTTLCTPAGNSGKCPGAKG